jgi:hypothetical protein
MEAQRDFNKQKQHAKMPSQMMPKQRITCDIKETIYVLTGASCAVAHAWTSLPNNCSLFKKKGSRKAKL